MPQAPGELVPFLIFLKSLEVLLYEVMSWLVFYPRTLWRSVRHPLRIMKSSEEELKLPAPEQFREVVSPPIFLLLTVVAANGFEVALVGHSALIDNGIGLAAMITDNTTLILFRLIVFAMLPVVAAAFALANLHKPLNRDTLQPLFYAQCFATAPVVLMCNVAEALTRLPRPSANVPAALLFAASAVFYLGVEASWFSRESRRGILAGLVWASAALIISLVLLAAVLLLFSGA
jgi:hypothetical protein